MNSLVRVGAVCILGTLFATSGFADGPAKTKKKVVRTNAASADVASSAKDSTVGSRSSASAPAAGQAAPAATKAAPRKKELPEAPKWTPMPATTGTIGLFTDETGETLPKNGISFSAGVNKFSRNPGEITVLEAGWSVGVGLTDRWNVYVQFDPHRHIHVDNASRLSLSGPVPPVSPFVLCGNSIYRCIKPPPIPSNAAYVEDFPFAGFNGGGLGDFTVGVKYGILSEQRGDRVGLSIRNDVIIPTHTGLADLLNNQVQTGQLNDTIGVAVSKAIFRKTILATVNWSYRFTQDKSYTVSVGGSPQTLHVNLANQMRVGAGFLMFANKRIQLLSEYNGLIFLGSHTPNTSFGARDPVETVAGARFYLARYFALDLGYREVLNLSSHSDRNGFIVKLGSVYWPEKPKAPDDVRATCTLEKNSVMAESNETIGSSVRATDTYDHPLNYTWSATGGKIQGNGPDVRWDSTGVAPGNYTLTARVDDGRGNGSSCSGDIKVEAKPVPPPTMTCSVDRSSVLVGERVQVTAAVNDQSGTPLNYVWQTNGGQIVGSGSSVQLDTSGLAAGNYTVTGRVENGKGGAADCSAGVGVQVPPPPPLASKLNECSFRAGSARVDNVCKRILDDVALRLQTEPKAKVVVVGYADPGERKPDKLAKDRGTNSKKYLAEKKGVADTRVEVRAAGGQKGAGKQNRRLDIIWVPDGASY